MTQPCARFTGVRQGLDRERQSAVGIQAFAILSILWTSAADGADRAPTSSFTGKSLSALLVVCSDRLLFDQCEHTIAASPARVTGCGGARARLCGEVASSSSFSEGEAGDMRAKGCGLFF